jgi:hypothetical protein
MQKLALVLQPQLVRNDLGVFKQIVRNIAHNHATRRRTFKGAKRDEAVARPNVKQDLVLAKLRVVQHLRAYRMKVCTGCPHAFRVAAKTPV